MNPAIIGLRGTAAEGVRVSIIASASCYDARLFYVAVGPRRFCYVCGGGGGV